MIGFLGFLATLLGVTAIVHDPDAQTYATLAVAYAVLAVSAKGEKS